MGFNPHPLRSERVTRPERSARRPVLCFNPHPLRSERVTPPSQSASRQGVSPLSARTWSGGPILRASALSSQAKPGSAPAFGRCAKGYGFSRSLGVRARSNHQGRVEIHGLEVAVFLDMQVNGFRQPIKPQAVFGRFDNVQQSPFQFLELHGIYLALEHGLLHTLTDGLTSLGDAA